MIDADRAISIACAAAITRGWGAVSAAYYDAVLTTVDDREMWFVDFKDQLDR